MAQSAIQFMRKTDVATQGTAPPSQRDTTSSLATPSSYSPCGTSQREDTLLAGMNDLEDDPWDIMMFQMDKAMSNIGAVSNIFDRHKKGIMLEFWQSWQFTSWNLLNEQLTNVKHAQEFI